MFRNFVFAGGLFIFTMCVCQFSAAQGSAVPAVQPPQAAQPVKSEILLPLSLDDAKSVAEIKQFLASIEEKIKSEFTEIVKKTEPTPVVIAGFLKRQGEHFLNAGEKVLKLADNDIDRELGYHLKIQGFKQLSQQERFVVLDKLRTENKLDEKDPQYQEKMSPLFLKVQQMETSVQKDFDALLAEIEKTGKFKEILLREQFERFTGKIITCRESFSPELFEQLKKEAKEWTARQVQGIPQERPLIMLLSVAASDAAQKNDPNLALKAIEEITAFVNSPQCNFQPEKKKQLTELLEKQKKLCPGSNMNLYGKTLDDKNFDWVSLRGKVVLVLFTADWCVPCREELPVLRSVYEKYKAKGFEIVSVYIGEKKDGDVKQFVSDEKLPWIILSETLTKKAGKAEQSEEYMISQVPTMFLIAKDGRTLGQVPAAAVLDAKLAAMLGQ